MKTKLKQLFTSCRKAGTLPQHQQQSSSVLPTSLPFTLRKISELSVNDWIRCDIENDLSVLIISGNPTAEELQLHYNDIAIEYHDLIGSSATRNMLMMRKKMIRLQYKIKQAIYCTNAYLYKRDKRLKEILSSLNFRFESSKSDQHILKLLEAHVKNWTVDLQKMQADIDTYVQKNKSADKVTRRTYLENIVALKKEGFDININATMLDEYAVAFNAFNQIMEAKQSKAA